MSLSVISPINSFIRFNESAADPLCIWGTVNFCLPVYDQEDVYFQFVVTGTESEVDSLCTQDGEDVVIELVSECNGFALLTFDEKPDRYRLSTTQVLYNWSHGLPNFSSVIAIGSCFKVQLTITGHPYGYPDAQVIVCSNCFERIGDPCFTSVIEYGNDEDGFDFKYCHGGNIDDPDNPIVLSCDPTIVTFASVATLVIPYTALLQDKYGVFPTVQVWIYDEYGQLVNMGITATFDGYPPTLINLDFGGSASGIVIIR